jgi:hypothetical protein
VAGASHRSISRILGLRPELGTGSPVPPPHGHVTLYSGLHK